MDSDFQPEADRHRSAIVYQSQADFATRSLSDWTIPVTMPPPRPGHFAEREELDAALPQAPLMPAPVFWNATPESRYRPEAESALRKFDNPPPSTR